MREGTNCIEAHGGRLGTEAHCPRARVPRSAELPDGTRHAKPAARDAPPAFPRRGMASGETSPLSTQGP